MISDLFFVIRMFALTVFVVIFMQAKIGGKTIEAYFQGWLMQSVFVDYIHETVDIVADVTTTSYQRVHSGISGVLGKLSQRRGPAETKKEGRLETFTLKRHKVEEAVEDMEKFIPTAPQMDSAVRAGGDGYPEPE